MVKGLTLEVSLVMEMLGHLSDCVTPLRLLQISVTLHSVSVGLMGEREGGKEREREQRKEEGRERG